MESTGTNRTEQGGAERSVTERDVTERDVTERNGTPISSQPEWENPELDHDYRRILKYLHIKGDDPLAFEDGLAVLYGHIQKGEKVYHEYNKAFRKMVSAAMRRMAGGEFSRMERMNETYYRSLLMDARVDFDAFNLYLERNIPPDKKIYLPRRKALMPFVKALQEAHDGKVDFVSGSVPKRVGKTTIGTRFVLFREGNSPMSSSLCCGSGDALVRSFYTGMLEVLSDKEKYAYYDIFPDSQLVATNADLKTLDLQKKTRFASITCRSIDGSLTGNTEANAGGVLYGDDFVANEEESTSRDRLDVLYNKITGDLLGRWLGGPIVFFGTRYSLYDPMGRFQDYARDRNWRTRIIEIPALDPVTDESNFEMTVGGVKLFTTQYFRDMRAAVTEIQWASQYQQQPFEAKGRLFPENDLNRYFSLPTDKDPDAIVAVCDTAERGSDSVMLPVAYIYGDDVFIEDCVFSNATPEHTKPECANILVKHKVGTCTFESNNAGEYFARDVEVLMKQLGGKTSIKTKRTISNKATRIENSSSNILKHFYFKDKSLYSPNSEYGMMIKELVSYTRSGKVKHDDSPDGLSLLENELRRMNVGKVEVMRRPW